MGGAALRIGGGEARNVFGPEHGEVRCHHLVARGQVQPDLEQLQRVGRSGVQQREHLRMHDAFARREPLHITVAKTGGGTEGVGMVDTPLAHHGHGFKTPVRVAGKTRHRVAVVHAPAVLAAEVRTQLAARQQGFVHGHVAVALRVGVVVVRAEQEGVGRRPRKTERLGAEDNRAGGHGVLSWVGTRPDNRARPSSAYGDTAFKTKVPRAEHFGSGGRTVGRTPNAIFTSQIGL